MITEGDSIDEVDITLLNYNVNSTAKLDNDNFVFGPVNGKIGSNPTIFSGEISKIENDTLLLELKMDIVATGGTIFCDVKFSK